jgi:predicted nucleic acid-binding protein
MIHVLLDTNILLDVICSRTPFVIASREVWRAAESGRIQASVTPYSLGTVFYVARKQLGGPVAWKAIEDVVALFGICSTGRVGVELALKRPWTDFEDALQDAAAEVSGIATIVTRDKSHFVGSIHRIVDAVELMAELNAPP